MTGTAQATPPRKPRVFEADDPALSVQPAAVEPEPEVAAEATPGEETAAASVPASERMRRGVRWLAILVSATLALAGIAASLSFARFVSIALERQDFIGWIAFGLIAIAGLAAVVILGRELVGLLRLARLRELRREVDTALARRDSKAERRAIAHLKRLFSARADVRWSLARLAEHERDVRDPGQLLALADREVLAPLDAQARRAIMASAKRVATVTAMSPIATIAVVYVLIENVRMLRALAGIYGGRPGGVGALRLAGLVVGHIIATGGIAMTDDMLGQFIGQDLLRRLSRRLGEGVFNGALTARVGAAGIAVCRPIPFIEATPVRARDIAGELFKRASPQKGR
jgi:putative membrane protein